jgi:hypothetical protein
MIDNQTYVKHILQLAGEENLVDVETDSSYNNRPQPGCEAATQTFCPNVTLLFVVMNRLHDLRTGITGYGSNFKYALAIDGV